MRLSTLVALPACAVALQSEHAANPIRKVVTMLQMMQKKVEQEGEKEKELFDKFMCYCKNSGGDLAKSIADAEEAGPRLDSDIKAAEAQLAQLKQDLAAANEGRVAAKSAMDEATAIREKDAALHADKVADIQKDIDDLTKGVKALQMGNVMGFLQSKSASMLKKVVLNDDTMADLDRHDLTAFLTNTESQWTGNSMDENIAVAIGIMQQLADKFTKEVAGMEEEEAAAIKTYEELIAAKKEEIKALSVAIEEKSPRLGELGVSLVEMKNDLSDGAESIVADKKFAAELEKSCATKEKEWAVIVKTRQEEILAIADTIKILNDDDALEMFKKALPSPSFMQLQETDLAVKTRALALLQEARAAKPSDRQRIDFIMMMMRGKKVGFEKVFKMIDNMVELLKKEQGEDDEKREYCKAAFDEAEDKIKVPTRREGQLETQIAEAKENIVTFKEEIKALGESIKDLDKTVKDATEQREEENSDHKTLMINDQAAKELLVFAKNRLNKFYNPKLYVPESFVQISMHNNEAPPPPPEGPSAYKKNSEGGNSVVAMIDSLVKDLDMEMSESETNERLAQENYEEMMQDSKEKRQADTKSLTEKSEALADTEDTLNAKSDELTSTQKEIMAAHEYMGQLHGECDWLMKFYDVRKKARDSELQTLSKAKAILNGADFSLVQVKSRRFLHHQ